MESVNKYFGATSMPNTTKPSISSTTMKPSMKEDFVLVLYSTGNTFMFDRKSGEKWPLYYFENKENLKIQQGCSVVYKSKMLIIGGTQSTMNKKIAKVDGCGIKVMELYHKQCIIMIAGFMSLKITL